MMSPPDWRAAAYPLSPAYQSGGSVPIGAEIVRASASSEYRARCGSPREWDVLDHPLSPSADEQVRRSVAGGTLLEDYWLTLNVLADPPTGWIVSIRNNHTRPFSAVVVALKEWRQCSSGDLEHTSEQTPDVLLEADVLESNSPALCSRIFEYSSDDSILRVGHSIEESAAGYGGLP
jgi:hypothetical protein